MSGDIFDCWNYGIQWGEGRDSAEPYNAQEGSPIGKNHPLQNADGATFEEIELE